MQDQIIQWPYDATQFTIFCFVVEAEEVTPEFVADVKAYARTKGISYHQWLDHMMSLYRDYRGVIVDCAMDEVFLETVQHFEQTPNIKFWFRDQLVPSGVVAKYTRKESFERFRIWATILKARDPDAAKLWGKPKP